MDDSNQILKLIAALAVAGASSSNYDAFILSTRGHPALDLTLGDLSHLKLGHALEIIAILEKIQKD